MSNEGGEGRRHWSPPGAGGGGNVRGGILEGREGRRWEGGLVRRLAEGRQTIRICGAASGRRPSQYSLGPYPPHPGSQFQNWTHK